MISLVRQRLPLRVVFTFVLTVVIAATTGRAGVSLAHEADGHPARIHEGSCDALGRVTEKLTGIGAEINAEGTPVPAVDLVGSAAATPLDLSTTSLAVPMHDLVDAPHALVVYASDEAMDQTLACGDIGGSVMMQNPGAPGPGDELAIWLSATGDAGRPGLALLRAEEGDTSSITVILADNASGEDMPSDDHGHDEGTPEATPHTS